MFEIIVAIIIVICIIYIFRGDFSKKEVGVTVLKSLPLSIFKKWSKEDKSINKRDMNNDISEDIKEIDNNINDESNEVLQEVAVDIISEKVQEAKNDIVSEGTETNEVKNRDEYLNETEEIINKNSAERLINETEKFTDSQEDFESNTSIEIEEGLDSIDLECINNEVVVEEFNNTVENILEDDFKDNSDVSIIDDIQEVIENKEIIDEIKEKEIVYWTPNGKTYHVKNTCRTLARSKVINSGTIYESGKDFKCEHCK